jgi:hypothetical protein
MNETPREKWRRPTRSGSGGYVACYGPVSPDPVQEEPAAAITRVVHDYACGCEKQWPVSANYEQMQDAIASALSRGGWVQLTDPEALAREFHEAYERLAPAFDYATRKESAVSWEDVPRQNRALMVATAERVLSKLAPLQQEDE